jgi:hypothetical protein
VVVEIADVRYAKETVTDDQTKGSAVGKQAE